MKILKIVLLTLSTIIYFGCDPNNGGGGDGKQEDPIPSTEKLEIKDTAYGTASRNVMDIYLPKDRDENTPTIVLVHGGAWQAGNKSDMQVLVNLLQKEMPEAAIANINYRLANGNSVTAEQINEDIDAAISFLSDNREEFNISNKFALIGASAGAHLAMLYAYKYDNENRIKCVSDLFGPSLIDDWEWYNSYNVFLGANIKDILKNYTGTFWDTMVYKAYSPLRQLTTTQNVPTIIFHGTLDPIVPIYQSQWLKARLTELNIPFQYVEYVDFHGFNDENYKDCVKKTVAFFKNHL